MAKLCRTCKGRGRWQERVQNSTGTQLIWYECNDCHGTGINQDPEEGDDFDIAGGSYEDGD